MESIDAPFPGVWRRVLGMIWSPRSTLEQVVARPLWLGMLLATIVVPAATGAMWLSTDTGQRALVAQQVRGMEQFGLEVTDEQYERLDEMAQYAPWLQAVSVGLWVSGLTLVVSTLLFVVSHGMLGGRATFKQTATSVVHAGAVFIAQSLFVGPLNYYRAELSNPATLAAFVPMLDPETFVVRFLGLVDVFFIWWIVLLAMGTAVTTGHRTTPVAVGLLALYAAGAATIAIVLGRFAG